MTTSYRVGVDGGGTKTAALLADAGGAVLGRGAAGSSNYQKMGFAAASAAVRAAIAQAYADAGCEDAEPAAICLGLAGVDRAEDQLLWEHWLRARFPRTRFCVVNDAELPLAAGTPEGWGVGVICGTGSICVGRNRAGQMQRADGWGYLLGDDGSGYAIGRHSLRVILRARDGRSGHTMLTDAVLAHWSLSAPEQLLDRVYIEDATPALISSLAPVVNRCAEAGDASAAAILKDAGRELAVSIAAVAQGLGMAAEPVPCALAGGVVTRSRLVAASLLEQASALGVRLHPVEMVAEPVLGALRLAERLVQPPLPPRVLP